MSAPATSLNLLIDACLGRSVVDRLRADGHDVVWTPDLGADPGDRAILALAAGQSRIIVTIDTDFGTLVFRDEESSSGILRLRERPAAAQAERASMLVAQHAEALVAGALVTDDGESERVTRKA